MHALGVSAHVMSRGYDKGCIFTDACDYERYLAILADGLQRFGVDCHALCLLWNHLHLVVTPWDSPLASLMQQVNSHYCEWLNQRHRRSGYVLQGRYKCKVVEDGSYFLNVIRYVVLNPVAAETVRTPVDWPWSSYRATMGLDASPVPLNVERIWKSLDAATEREGRERLRVFIESGDRPEALWGPLIEGSERFRDQLAPLLQPHQGTCEFTYAHRFASRPSLASLLSGVGDRGEREERARVAFMHHAYTLAEIGKAWDLHPSTVWHWVRRARQRCG